MQLTTVEAIRQIQGVYKSQYDPASFFSVFDQLLICETLAEAIPVKERFVEENTSVNRSVNDSSKQQINAELFSGKQHLIEQLRKSTYRTPPCEVATYLETLFADYQSRSVHWLYVAQHWAPRRINGVINRLIRLQKTGSKTIANPAAYFTFLIKKRVRRREDSRYQ